MNVTKGRTFASESRFIFVLTAILLAVIAYVGFVSCFAWVGDAGIQNISESPSVFERNAVEIVLSSSFGMVCGSIACCLIAIFHCGKK